MKKRNLFKQSVSVMLALLIVLSSLVIIPMASAEEGDGELPAAWDGLTVDYSWYKVADAGTAEKPYEIANGAQLAAWSNLSNGTYTPADIGEEAAAPKYFNDKYFVLTADIDMGNNPIVPIVAGFADSATWFWLNDFGSGLNFDGQGHTIYNLEINSFAPARKVTVDGAEKNFGPANGAALFAAIGPKSTVKNIKFVGAHSKCAESGWNVAAIVVAYASGDNMTFENIMIDETSLVEGYRICGSIAGYLMDRDATKESPVTTIKNCIMAGKIVTTGARSGGIVGCHIVANTTIDAENCVFAGGIEFTSNATGGVATGGMFGCSMDVATELNLTNCVNLGVFYTRDGETHAKDYDVAGLAATYSNKVWHNVNNCYDRGTYNFNTSKAIHLYGIVWDKMPAKSTFNACYSVGNEIVDPQFAVADLKTTIETAPFTYSTVEKEILAIISQLAGRDMLDEYLSLIAWDGLTVDYSWYKKAGAGTAENPYEIDSAAAMAGWSNLSNGTYTPADIGETGDATKKVFNDKYFVLTTDINFAGNPILPITAGAMESQKWVNASGSGLHFDGQGCTIYNLSINAPAPGTDAHALFGHIGPNSSVKNLNFVGAQVKHTKTNWTPAAILAAYAPSEGILFENITIDETSVVDGWRIVGGIAAYMMDRATDKVAPTANFKNCVVKATLKGTGARCAGILACHIADKGVMNFENCVFAGNFEFKLENLTNAHTPGIAGITMDVTSTLNFKNCVNLGNFYTAEGVTLAPKQAANVSGISDPATNKSTQSFENCFDNSTIAITSDAAVAKTAIVNGATVASIANSFAIAQDGVNYSDAANVAADASVVVAGIDAISKNMLIASLGIGMGTEADPVVIATAEDLCTFAVNAAYFTETVYVNLAADVRVTADTSFAPIVMAAPIILNGGGHKITFNCDTENPAQALFAGVLPEGSDIVGDFNIDKADHEFEFACSVECVNCGIANTAAAAHTFPKACSEACSVCGEENANATAHTYDHDCDEDCNECGEIRDVEGHEYDGACDEKCNNCDSDNPDKVAHTWTNDCDTECDVCGETRETEHKPAAPCDTSCDVCGESVEATGEHTFDGPCDANCNGCGLKRKAGEHTYDDEYDADCNVCGVTRTVEERPAPEEPDDNKPEDDKKEDDTTTKAPDTTKAPAPGCGGSIAGVGALLALTATFGFAFVGKKKED